MASKIIVDQVQKSGLTALTLPTGNASAGQVLQNDGSGNLSWAADAGGLFASYAFIVDQKTQASDSGTFTSGAWRTRDLQTTITDTDSIVTALTGNEFTLAAGSYLIKWSAPAHMVEENQTRLYDVTGSGSSPSWIQCVHLCQPPHLYLRRTIKWCCTGYTEFP